MRTGHLFAVDCADDSIILSDLRTRWEWDPLRAIRASKKNCGFARTERNRLEVTRLLRLLRTNKR